MPSAWKLIIEDDAGKQIVVPFTRDVITIGRKEGNTIRLTERNVSRNHARLAKENGHVVLEDLQSFNGIKLNGDRIDGRVLVHEGDTIQIGDYHLALHAQDGVAANAAPTHKMVPASGGAPPPRSQATQSTVGDDDEFAGDTQRWEPPAASPGISVQSLPTQEDRPPISDEHTVPAPVARPGGFGPENGDTERVSLDSGSALGLDAMKAGAPSPVPTRAREGELEPTLRQSLAPPPITLPPAAPMPSATGGNGAQGLAAPSPLAPPAHSDARPMPSPASTPPLSPPPPSRAPVRQPVLDNEQTDMLRPAPGVADDLSVPRLVVLNTIFAGSTFSLRAAEAVIGRTEENDITIEHRSVSRNHAKVVREGDRVRILDLKSANGVLVNDEDVEAAVLRPGDVVELGRVKLRFVPVGERFVVPADEIERARVADAAGDDFDNDVRTGVTNPIRQKERIASGQQISSMSDGFALPSGSRPPLFYAAIAGGVLLLLVIIAAALSGGDDDEAPASAPTAHAGPSPSGPAAGDPPPARIEPKPVVADPKPAAAEPKPVDAAPVDAAPSEPEEPALAVDNAPAPEPERERRPPRRRRMTLQQMQDAVRQAREQKCPNKEKWIPKLRQVLASDPPEQLRKDAELFLNFCPK